MSTSEKVPGRWKKWVVYSWSFIEVFLFGGIIFGWGSLVFVLKEEGIYAHLCPRKGLKVNDINSSFDKVNVSDLGDRVSANSTSVLPFMLSSTTTTRREIWKANRILTVASPVCEAQDQKFALCFAIASALLCFSSAVMGQINNTFGTRTTRQVAFVIFTAGALMLAFVEVDVPWLIFPGLALIGVGGLPLVVTDIQVSNWFMKGRSTIVAGLAGVFDMSSGVQLIAKLLYERGFSRRNTYFVIAGLHCLTLVSTFCFLPKRFITVKGNSKCHDITVQAEKDAMKTLTATEQSINSSVSTISSKNVVLDGQRSTPSTLLNCIKQPIFIMHCVWLCILQLRLYRFMGSLNTYLNRILDADKSAVSYFTNVGLYTMMGGAMSSLLVGMIYDWQKHRYQGAKTLLYQTLGPAVLPLALTSSLFTLFSVITIFQSKAVIYLVFLCMTLARAFLYGIAMAFLSLVFPNEYFAVLFGIVYAAGGVFCFLQYAFFSWAESYTDAPLHADLALLVLVLVSFIHPAYIRYICTRKEQEYQAKNQNSMKY